MWLVQPPSINKDLFRELSNANSTKVWVGNGNYIVVKGKGTIAISTYSCTNLISDVLYVPEIDQNLFSVGQLIEKVYKVLFENESCLIKDSDDKDIFKVKMKGKSFALNPLEEDCFSNERKCHRLMAQKVVALSSSRSTAIEIQGDGK